MSLGLFQRQKGGMSLPLDLSSACTLPRNSDEREQKMKERLGDKREMSRFDELVKQIIKESREDFFDFINYSKYG